MKTLFIMALWSCSEKANEDTPIDSGIIVGPPPQPEDTAINQDTGLEDTGIEDTGVLDSGLEDTGIDTAIADTAQTEPSQEDTAVEAQLMPDFSLPDVNPYSPTFGSTISVRDQMESISGWYFIKAT